MAAARYNALQRTRPARRRSFTAARPRGICLGTAANQGNTMPEPIDRDALHAEQRRIEGQLTGMPTA